MQQPDEVRRAIYVHSSHMWTVITSVPGDPYAFRVDRVRPGERDWHGYLLPTGPGQPTIEGYTSEEVKNLSELEEIFRVIGVRPSDLAHRLFEWAWSALNDKIPLDRGIGRVPTSSIMYHIHRPRTSGEK